MSHDIYKTDRAPDGARLLTERQKAAELQVSLSFLRKDRMKDEPDVPYTKIGRAVRYFPTPEAD